MSHLRDSCYSGTLELMTPSKPLAGPDASVAVYVTEHPDGRHRVAINWTTPETTYVIAVGAAAARELADNLPALLRTAADGADQLDGTAKLVVPTPNVINQVTRERN